MTSWLKARINTTYETDTIDTAQLYVREESFLIFNLK